MNPLIRNVIALFFLLPFLISYSFAGTGGTMPAGRLSERFTETILRIDSFLSSSLAVQPIGEESEASSKAAPGAGFSSGRICSCQIMNLESSNYNHRHIAVFAEKTNHGSAADFNAARSRIRRERKHLKQMFYDKVEVVAEISAEGTCHSMYLKLKSDDAHLQIYEILNADIR
jgi:hypothetical protein